MTKIEWSKNLNSEIEFWRRWCLTKGELWPDDFAFRLNPYNELQEEYRNFINENSVVLDCGSGMYTVLGRNINGKRIEIHCIDALARHFEILRLEYDMPEIDWIYPGAIEEIDYIKNFYDFVHAQNSLDHSFDPVQCYKNMMEVCRDGGIIYTRHEINEGKNENYHGLHQWNFFENNGFCIADKHGNTTNVSEIFKEHKQETFMNKGWITYIIYKNGRS